MVIECPLTTFLVTPYHLLASNSDHGLLVGKEFPLLLKRMLTIAMFWMEEAGHERYRAEAQALARNKQPQVGAVFLR